ncbi:MAG: type II secretion system F family protein [Acidisphaera sp.]|nr:type II secretion system F family protein [Acidisphaera sp.]
MFGSGSTHLVIFAKQFASMMGSSLQLVTVLDNLARETPQRRLRAAVAEVARQVTTGVDLADALERFPRLFNGVFVGLVRSGIEAGRLAGALNHVVDYLDRLEQVNRRVAGAAVYPIFVLMTFLGVASGMIFFILPKYQVIFRGFGKDLPAPTQFLLDIGDLLKANAAWLGGVLVLLGLIAASAVSTRNGRLAWDRLKLRLPVLGPVWRLAALARFSRTLAVQVSNHVTVIRALHLAAAAAGNRYVERLVHGIADDVELGASVTRAFKDREIFAGIVLQMIAAGEEAGRLDELLLSAANYFDSLLIQRIETVTGLINPMLTALVGAATAGMMVAAFLPVFDMPGAMQ